MRLREAGCTLKSTHTRGILQPYTHLLLFYHTDRVQKVKQDHKLKGNQGLTLILNQQGCRSMAQWRFV